MLHLDADAFFVACEQAADAKLRGRPVAVGGERRGIIASASYEARKMGVYTPMPTARARKICPRLIIVPGDWEKYELFSRLMFSYAYDLTPMVEIGSIDEGYCDLSGNRKIDPRTAAERMRDAIRQTLKITVSEGLGSNKLIAGIASKLRKPNCFIEVPPGGEQAFLSPLEVKWLPGIGPANQKLLHSAGLRRIEQVASMTPRDLSLLVGGRARQLWEFAHGIDERPLVPDSPEPKSYGHQETFGEDTTSFDFARATLLKSADRLMADIRSDGKMIRTIEVRIRYNDMEECRRSQSLYEPTDLETDLYSTIERLLKKAWERRVSLRLVALKLSHVYPAIHQTGLGLVGAGEDREERRRLADAVDRIREEHGEYAVKRGHVLMSDLGCQMSDVVPARSGATVASSNLPGSQHGSHSKLPRQLRCRHIRHPTSDIQHRHVSFIDSAVRKAFDQAPSRSDITPFFLNVRSYYSFLDSLLSPAQIVEMAVKAGARAVAITDPNLHGAVEFFQAAKDAGIKAIIGAEVEIEGKPWLAYAKNEEGYGWISDVGFRMSDVVPTRSEATVASSNLPASQHVSCPKPPYQSIRGLHPTSNIRHPTSNCILLPPSTFPTVRYFRRSDARFFEVLQSIRTLSLAGEEHPEKRVGEFHFPGKQERAEWRARNPESIRAAEQIIEECEFEFELGGLRFPHYFPDDGSTPHDFLKRLAFEGMYRRYGAKASEREAQLREELAIIAEVGYEEYFLQVWDILQECKARGISWITRGSAADSLVCYCLGISDVCPIRFELYFRRFLNRDRMALNKLPDIDIDFAHDRKDDVVDLIFEKYGNEHCAVVGGFSTYQGRSAFADIAKAMGVSEYQIRRYTEHLPHTSAGHVAAAVRDSRETKDLPWDENPYQTALELAAKLDGFPRYAKMHPCGVVLSRDPIHRLTPTFSSAKGYPTTHFDMDSVEAIGLIKMDILAQGGLAVMRDALAAIERNHGVTIDLGALAPWDDPEIWKMIAAGEARGVHHIESPAMTSLQRMVGANNIDDLIAIVSVIRPGAANSMRKVSFARRAQGLEPIDYVHPSLEPVLRSTYGVVAYEEHILQICEAFAGLGAGRADLLRRALVKQQLAKVEELRGEFVAAAEAIGRTPEEIESVWSLIIGFKGYAFCRAHSTAYGLEAYQAAHLKRYYPAEFLAAVLTHGKGFYNRLVYSIECRRRGIGFRLPDVNRSMESYFGCGMSDVGCGLERSFEVSSCISNEAKPVDSGKQPSLRSDAGLHPTSDIPHPTSAILLPLWQIKGLRESTHDRIFAEREKTPFRSLEDFYNRVGADHTEMQNLIRAGAFDGFGKSRAELFWEFRALAAARGIGVALRTRQMQLPLDARRAPRVADERTRLEQLRDEVELFGFTVTADPLELYPDVRWESYCRIADLGNFKHQRVTTCGLIIENRLHHQVDGQMMKFLSLYDRTGILECELFADTYRKFGIQTIRHPILEVTGTVEPFDNHNGFTLRVEKANRCRRADCGSRI